MKRFLVLCAVLGILVATWIPAAQATLFTLEDDNSTAVIDTEAITGMSDWVVDGIDHLATQWFWYRVGDTGPETSIDELTLDGEAATDTNIDGDDDNLFVRYAGTGFNIEVNFRLAGGTDGSGTSDITEQIRIVNTGGNALDFHFYQYTDFDLSETPDDDSVSLRNPNTFGQSDAGMFASETIATPQAEHYEAAIYNTTLLKLEDTLATTLSDTQSPLGPANVTFGWQWDTTIAAGGSFQISKDKQITPIPEPTTLLLLGFGLAGLAGYAWQRKKKQS